METYIKRDNKLVAQEITPAIPEKIEEKEYDLRFLKEQERNISGDIERLSIDLVKVRRLISEAENLGITVEIIGQSL